MLIHSPARDHSAHEQVARCGHEAKLLLVDDFSVFVPLEDTKLIQPIPAGAKHFQFARTQRVQTS